MRSYCKVAVLALLVLAACTTSDNIPFGVNPAGPPPVAQPKFTGSIQVGTLLGGDHAVLNLVGAKRLDTLAAFEWYPTTIDRLTETNRTAAGREHYPYVVIQPGGTYVTFLRWRTSPDSAWHFTDVFYTRPANGTWPLKGTFIDASP